MKLPQKAKVDPDLAEAREYLSNRLNLFAGQISDRSDLVVGVKWDKKPDSTPAWHLLKKGEIWINGNCACKVHPDWIDPTTREGRLEQPEIIGLLCHEVSHAHSTKWTENFHNFKHVKPAVFRAAKLLEEVRIEKRLYDRRPGDRIYIRAAAKMINLASLKSQADVSDTWQAASQAVLVLGRVDCGTLDSDDISDDVLTLLEDSLGKDTLAELQSIWNEVLEVGDFDGTSMIELGERFLDTLDIDPDEKVDDNSCGEGKENPTESEDSEDADESELTAAIQRDLGQVSEDAQEEAAEKVKPPKSFKREDAEEREAQQDASDQANKVFGYGARKAGHHRARTAKRSPRSDERIQANRLANRLRKARFRGRKVEIVASEAPPGKVASKEAMLGSAQRALGMPVTAQPFRQKRSRHVQSPPFVCGIMCDVSASMRPVVSKVSSTAWIVAEATARIGGKSATVAYGYTVTPITTGRSDMVTEFNANDGNHHFTGAVKALDGQLGLSKSGARLLVIVSDGQHEDEEWDPGQKLIHRLAKSGCAILWICLKEHDLRAMEGSEIAMVDQANEMSTVIADAAVKGLQKA